jgi:hypothetical protein
VPWTTERRLFGSRAARVQPRGGIAFRALSLAALCAACGGGGGGGGGTPSPIPTIPIVTATPGPGVTPTPTPVVSDVDVIFREGEPLAGVGNISDVESAALARDGHIAAILQISGAGGARAVVRRSPAGEVTTVFSPSGADIDTSTLETVQVGAGGTMLFRSGRGLDSHRLYIADQAGTRVLAGAPPGLVGPLFRILGRSAVGPSGLVGFVGGGSPCTVMQQGESVRVRCLDHVFVGDASGVSEVEIPDVDLSNQSVTTPQMEITDSGVMYFSVPGSGDAPTIVQRRPDGSVRTVLLASDEVEPVGRLIRPQLNGVNAAGDLLVTTSLQADPGPSRPSVIGILRDGELVAIARETSGQSPGPDDVTDVRAIGIDDTGSVAFTAVLGTADSPGGPRRSLRIFDGTAVHEIATESALFPGTDLTVLELSSTRMSRAGDVAFVATLGRRQPGTQIIEELRAVVRHPDGSLQSPISTRNAGPLGALSDIDVAGIGEDGSLLCVGQAAPSGDRVLLLVAPAS